MYFHILSRKDLLTGVVCWGPDAPRVQGLLLVWRKQWAWGGRTQKAERRWVTVCSGGLQVVGTSHCCSSNIKTENPSRETGMIKAVQKCRCLSGFPGSVEASKHISLLVLAAVGKQKPSAFRLSGARSRLSLGSASPAVPRGGHTSRLCPKEQPVCSCAAAFSKDIGC